MEFPTLYKYTTTGQPQQWQIFVDKDRFWIKEGLVNGVLTESKPTVCKSKNVGRSNATTPEQQAALEAQAKYQKKLDSNYNTVLTKEKKFFEPMLAHNYEDYKKLLFTVKTFIQPKLDGIRCISEANTLMSRKGKPFVSCPHLYQSVALLDGELYNHEFRDNFNKIVSLVKKAKPTEEELEETAKYAQHWIYDLPEKVGTFSERYAALELLFSDLKLEGRRAIKLVPTYEVETTEEIENYYGQFVNQGYEGAIIRLDLGPYENKRTKQLLKMKEFQDEEFIIVGVEEGEGGRTGTVGAFILRLPDGTDTRSNVKGSHEYIAKLWQSREDLIGRTATCKFFNYTPDGKPRFPFVTKIDRESYE